MKKKSNFHIFHKKDQKVKEDYFFQQIKCRKIIFKRNIHHIIYSKQSNQVEPTKHISNSKNKKVLFWMNSRFVLGLAKSQDTKICSQMRHEMYLVSPMENFRMKSLQ